MYRRTAVAAVTLALLLTLTACGRFARRDAAPPETEHVSVGADLDLSHVGPSTTVPGAAGQQPGEAAPVPVAPPQSPNPVSVTVDGFRLTLEVEGGTVHKADQPFGMALQVTNVSGSDRRYETNQRTYFVMETPEGGGSWRDSDCASGKPSGQPASVIRSGDTITFHARYPGPPERLDNSDACRRLPNDYVLVAGFIWCPDSAVFGEMCDPSGSRTLSSGSIVVRLT